MMKSKPLRIASYVGIGTAVLVPALVVAQQQTSPPTSRFGEGDLLRASEVRQLRDSLSEAILRLNTLEAGAGGVALSKGSIYTPDVVSVAAAAGTTSTATARCADANDIGLACNCGGNNNAISGTNQVNTRSWLLQNPAGAASSCACSGELVGAGPNINVQAQIICLQVE